ncbi:DsbE family thiol:disulfide interchange protein [Beggiatoa leptomitoformis]|uniref:DsbE family thiol:disulfide interchange protein n=1 Tax=Beggiatoa leptomitoformis TaxID=288004 RepID=A0A2N9YEX3_9GAMM|nr:DsbE family thiol:disulfide interchange protein [Beggiatoa leptomitoformis]ALG68742.1 DsbE family thiol:disulfide interchange protein [Beggiatoa leptomitoformis]AUI68899.1 DsbE family thiol:disulfide interchange protein [Beggiatoa leptomitoformis]
MLRYFAPLGIFAILAIFLYVGLGLNPRDLGSTLIDKPTPTFALPQLDNPTQIFTQDNFKGKVSLFNAWASWCVTCKYEHPLLMQLAKNTNIPIYGLNYKDTEIEAKQVLAREGNPYLANAVDAQGRVGMDLGLSGTPETFIIDKQGIIRYKHIGAITVEDLEKTILPLIKHLQDS